MKQHVGHGRSTTSYTADFYATHRAGSESSAKRVLPLVLEMVQARSAIDVGCGVGTWVKALHELGVDAIGMDGAWVTENSLVVPRDAFVQTDLSRTFEAPGGRRFDLAISMEVGEHLPVRAADSFVQSIARLAPVVVFSAAAPMQGGTDHVNEQWPAYWAAKFAAHGFAPIDCVRRRVWLDESVAWWYAQNTIVYASQEGLSRWPRLREAGVLQPREVLPLVHPGCLATRVSEGMSLGKIARALPGTIRGAVSGRIGGARGRRE